MLSKTADSGGQSPGSYTQCEYMIIRCWIIQAKQELRGVSSSISCSQQSQLDSQTRLLRGVFSLAWKRPQDRAGIALWSHCPTGRKFLPISNPNLSCCNCCLLSHVLTPCGTVKSLFLSPQELPCRYWGMLLGPTRAVSSAGLNQTHLLILFAEALSRASAPDLPRGYMPNSLQSASVCLNILLV